MQLLWKIDHYVMVARTNPLSLVYIYHADSYVRFWVGCLRLPEYSCTDANLCERPLSHQLLCHLIVISYMVSHWHFYLDHWAIFCYNVDQILMHNTDLFIAVPYICSWCAEFSVDILSSMSYSLLSPCLHVFCAIIEIHSCALSFIYGCLSSRRNCKDYKVINIFRWFITFVML